MAGIYLDMSGRLRSFSLVPVSDATRTAPGSGGESTGADAADGGDAWEPLFTAAALDREALREARPVTVPPVPSDRRIAWVRTGEGEDDGFRVEAASFEGAPVWFTVLPSGPLDPAKAAPRAPAAFLFGLGFCIAVLIAAAFLVRHNLRSGRGDRRGAFRLAVVVFWLNMLRWLFHCDHVATIDELGLFFNGLARAVALAFAVWLFYLALEPYVRRRWPQTIVSWSRAISGRLRDPLVGRDLLFGAAAGVALGLLERLEAIVPRWLSLPAAPVSRTLDARSLRTLLGVPDMLGELFHVARDAISVSFILLLALLLLRVIVRHRVIAFTLYIVVLTVIFRNATLRVDAGWFFDFAKALLGAALLVRLGVVAHVAAVLVYILVTAYPLTADVSAWYAGAGLFAAAVTLALAAFGFHVALAGRPLLRDELLQN